MKKYQLASLLWLMASMNGQNRVDLRTQSKNVDFSGAASTIPAKSGTTLPTTCNVGEQFFKTNAAAGQNIYACAPANTWTVVAAGNGSVATGTAGQFGVYSATGQAVSGHTLVATDIPSLNYQAPLSFTGNGSKTASSTGTLTPNDCAKWDANGNVVDAGGPCGSITTGTAGQFGFYTSGGATLSGHTLVAGDIPPLTYQAPLTFTGNGTKTASSTGALNANDCAKWDANGNVIDAGGPCASVGSGTTGQFGFYAANGTALSPHTLLAGDIPPLSYQAPLTFTGNGPKTASSAGALTTNDCAKWDANGNVVDAGGPCGTIATGTTGQFGFYAANGTALSPRTLTAGDIPTLNYQVPLSFTGTGTKTASSTGTLTANDCAKWDANGNVVDAGGPCGTIATGTTGQFGFYAANGTSLSPRTLTAGDIPTLNYQAPLSFTGTGTKTASSTGALTTNDCAKWDANGNVVDAGGPCGTIATGTTGQFGFYAANGTSLSPRTLTAGDIPTLNYQSPLSFTGTGTKTASSSGTLTTNDCVKWDANGNVVDAGGPCGTIATGTTGQFGFYAANGTALSPRTLTAGDIPTLNYQSLLSFTGTGTKTASSSGTLTTNDCAKWDANGNVVDAGGPCGTIATGTTGQFGFYAANGTALSPRTLTAGDIPTLNYQAPLSFTGTGTKTASSTGTLTTNDCAKWDANGNVVDAGGPCGTIATGTTGQFGFYAANGTTLSPRTLTAGDIPSLSYQAPLTFTGNGTKTASSTGTLTTNDCAKWDANGNVIDSGAPCGSIATGSTGQFGFYAANGTALSPRTLIAGDIPTLNYQTPLTFTGTGTKTASSTGTLTTNDCAKWDANGNAVDAGAPCASVASGTAGQFAVYSANGSAISAHTLLATDIPVLNYQAPLNFSGNGTKVATSTGLPVSGNCAMWDSGRNVVDAGAPCGSGSGGVSTPSTTTVGNVPQYSTTTGSALSVGLGVVTTVGATGSDSNLPTEKAVRTAIAASGGLPSQTGTASYLVSNGSTASWGNIQTGASGALDCATVPGVCDVVTAVVPLKASANTWTGANDFSGAAFLKTVNGSGVPASGCASSSDVGKVYTRSDAMTTGSSFFVCAQTGSGTFSWELTQSAGMPVYNASGAAQTNHMVTGRGTFSASTSTVTLSGSAAFSSATSYACTANDLSNAAAVRVAQTNGSSITFSITAGAATDSFSYICVGQ